MSLRDKTEFHAEHRNGKYLSPEGTIENSPAIHRREKKDPHVFLSSEGTTENSPAIHRREKRIRMFF